MESARNASRSASVIFVMSKAVAGVAIIAANASGTSFIGGLSSGARLWRTGSDKSGQAIAGFPAAQGRAGAAH